MYIIYATFYVEDPEEPHRMVPIKDHLFGPFNDGDKAAEIADRLEKTAAKGWSFVLEEVLDLLEAQDIDWSAPQAEIDEFYSDDGVS